MQIIQTSYSVFTVPHLKREVSDVFAIWYRVAPISGFLPINKDFHN